jgi:hypothetical protein
MEAKPDDYRDQIDDWMDKVCDLYEEDERDKNT